MNKVAITCPKCDGAKRITGFSHVANGVCFRCEGNGTILVRPAAVKPVAPLSPFQAGRVKLIAEGSDETFAGMNYHQLLELRDFAHWPLKQVPNLLELWRAKGEGFFQAAQEEKLEEFYARR